MRTRSHPPYGLGIGAWIAGAFDAAQHDPSTVVCLISARTDTCGWHRYVMKPRDPELLVAHVADARSEARSAARFAKALEAAGRDAGGKVVRSR